MKEDIPAPEVEESVEFDSFVGKTEISDSPASLAEMFGLDEDEIHEGKNEWKKHWRGMPEYEQPKKQSYKRLFLRFRNEEDYQEFAKLIDQKLGAKTKSIWYPEADKNDNSLLRWIDEES